MLNRYYHDHVLLACSCQSASICVHASAGMKKLFGAVSLHLSLSLSSPQACTQPSVKASVVVASRPLWCPAGTAAASRCQREGTDEDIELIATKAATNSRRGELVVADGNILTMCVYGVVEEEGKCVCVCPFLNTESWNDEWNQA